MYSFDIVDYEGSVMGKGQYLLTGRAYSQFSITAGAGLSALEITVGEKTIDLFSLIPQGWSGVIGDMEGYGMDVAGVYVDDKVIHLGEPTNPDFMRMALYNLASLKQLSAQPQLIDISKRIMELDPATTLKDVELYMQAEYDEWTSVLDQLSGLALPSGYLHEVIERVKLDLYKQVSYMIHPREADFSKDLSHILANSEFSQSDIRRRMTTGFDEFIGILEHRFLTNE